MRITLPVLLAFALTAVRAASASEWELETSLLTYHVTHPMHHVEGLSRHARGKGRADATALHLLVAVPVKSFDSGDSNRDSHMVEVTKGALHPMIVVHVTAPLVAESAAGATVSVDATVEFAGVTVAYKALPLFLTTPAPDHIHAIGTLVLSMKAFAIVRPSLLTIPISDEVPVDLDLTWRRRKP